MRWGFVLVLGFLGHCRVSILDEFEIESGAEEGGIRRDRYIAFSIRRSIHLPNEQGIPGTVVSKAACRFFVIRESWKPDGFCHQRAQGAAFWRRNSFKSGRKRIVYR